MTVLLDKPKAPPLPRPFYIRPATQDELVWRKVVLENEYRLPERFDPDDVILDVGANIGAFAYACLMRGCRHVHCFEPEPDNIDLLRRNLGEWPEGKYSIHRAAVWRDAQGVRLTERRKPYTAMHHTLLAVGAPCKSFDVNTLHCFGPARLLKLDCEGAEYPILTAARAFPGIQAIIGEVHYGMGEPGKPTPSNAWLTRTLKQLGFATVDIQPDSEHPEMIALFFSSR